MSQISVWRVTLIVCLVVAASGFALVGRDVLAWRGQTTRASVAVAASSGDFGVWEPGTWLPPAVSSWLLAARDDVEFGQAFQRFQLLRRGGGNVFFQRSRRSELAQAELDLDQLAAHAKSAGARSVARTLHGILLYQQLRTQTDPLTVFQRVTEEFRKAIHADPENAVAKYDLNAILGVFTPSAIAASQGDIPEKGAKTGSRTGGGGSAGNVTGGGGF